MPPLSPREAQCLTWIAKGKTYKDTAQILNISFSTVKAYLDTARAKLNASNLPHAVALAITLNIIALDHRSIQHQNLESVD